MARIVAYFLFANNSSTLPKRIKSKIKKNGWVKLLSLKKRKTTAKSPIKKPRLLFVRINENKKQRKRKKRVKKRGKIEKLNPPTGGVNFVDGGKFTVK